MWMYTFYVKLLIKKLPSLSIGQLNIINIVYIYIHILLFLCLSQRHVPARNTKGKAPISLV